MLAQPLRYTVDLMHLQTVCERNYWRLKKLLPELQTRSAYCFHWRQAGGHEQAELRVDVVERSTYTDTLMLSQTTSRLPWCPRLDMEVRLYHDAEMAEVVAFQAARRILARNRYPNRAMHSRDEKTQVNEFLAECLEHCLREGYVHWQLPDLVLSSGS